MRQQRKKKKRLNRLVLPEGGERKSSLTTTGLGEKQPKSETGPIPTKSSQSPLRIRSVQVKGVKELGSEEHSCWKPPSQPMSNLFCLRTSWRFSHVTSNEVPLVRFFFVQKDQMDGTIRMCERRMAVGWTNHFIVENTRP